MQSAVVMADHFDSIQKLKVEVEGVPNWRCVPGYQVGKLRETKMCNKLGGNIFNLVY